MSNPTQHKELIQLNDLDRPALPVDFPDYRDLLVVDSDGEDLGRIADILINPEDRKPLMAVVTFGGFMELGSKHILIPFQWLHDPTSETIQANFRRAQAETAPDFDLHGTKDFQPYFEYWFPSDTSAEPDPQLKPISDSTAPGYAPLLRISKAEPWQISAGIEDFRGRQVVDEAGDKMGVIEDWFLSLSQHRPVIAVVGRGGLLGAFSHHTMVPFDRLERVDDQVFRARIAPEELDGAPELGDDIRDFEPFFEYWKHPEAASNRQDTP